jgi:hypothetical protein
MVISSLNRWKGRRRAEFCRELSFPNLVLARAAKARYRLERLKREELALARSVNRSGCPKMRSVGLCGKAEGPNASTQGGPGGTPAQEDAEPPLTLRRAAASSLTPSLARLPLGPLAAPVLPS